MDAASGFAARTLDVREGDHVLDLCCSPGAAMKCLLNGQEGSLPSYASWLARGGLSRAWIATSSAFVLAGLISSARVTPQKYRSKIRVPELKALSGRWV